jgi:rubrerythrin
MSKTSQEIPKLSANEERLLNTLMDKEERETKPKRVGNEVVYEGLEELSKEIGKDELRKLLKSLASKGFLNEKDFDSAILCPNCNSIENYSRYICPQCQSLNVQKVQFLEHPFCGYIGDRREYGPDTNLVCPKCKTVLGDLIQAQSKTNTDKKRVIRVIGSSFICDKCGNKFERPLTSHTCERCGTNFTYKEANFERLPSYELTENVESLVPNRFTMDALRGVEKLIHEKGYKVELNAKIKGKSGVEQTFNLVARKDKTLLLLDVSAWGSQNDLISLLGKKMDFDSKPVILLDLAGNPNLASLGRPYNILVLDGKNEKYLDVLAGVLDDMERVHDATLRWTLAREKKGIKD